MTDRIVRHLRRSQMRRLRAIEGDALKRERGIRISRARAHRAALWVGCNVLGWLSLSALFSEIPGGLYTVTVILLALNLIIWGSLDNAGGTRTP